MDISLLWSIIQKQIYLNYLFKSLRGAGNIWTYQVAVEIKFSFWTHILVCWAIGKEPDLPSGELLSLVEMQHGDCSQAVVYGPIAAYRELAGPYVRLSSFLPAAKPHSKYALRYNMFLRVFFHVHNCCTAQGLLCACGWERGSPQDNLSIIACSTLWKSPRTPAINLSRLHFCLDAYMTYYHFIIAPALYFGVLGLRAN